VKRVAWAAVCAVLLAAGGAPAQKLPWQTGNGQPGVNAQLVHFLYPQQVTVRAGQPATIELHFRVQQGLHINSHTPPAKSLIGTELKVAEPQGVRVQAVLPGATRTEIWQRAGKDIDATLPGAVMDADDLVDAALLGFDRGEVVTIPPLADENQWTAYNDARLALAPNLSRRQVADRYRAAVAA